MQGSEITSGPSVCAERKLRKLVFVNRVYRPSEAATAQLLADLTDALAQRGWDVHVVATGSMEPERPRSGGPAGVVVHRTGPTVPHTGWASQAANYRRFRADMGRMLDGLLRPGDVVVALTDPPMLSACAARAAQARGARVVHWLQDIHPEVVAAHFGRLLAPVLWPLRWRRDRAWREAAACVPVSGAMAAHVRSRGVPADRVVAVPNWAPRELDQVAAPGDVAAWRAARNLGGKFVVAYSGNLGRVHEFTTMLGAASQLRDHPRIRFLVVGSGPRLPEVRAAAQRLALRNLQFEPPQPRADLATSLAAADVHLVTLRPGFGSFVSPSKLAGALAAGRPVVFVGPAEAADGLVAAEGCGAILAPGRPAELAALLGRWSDDRQASDEMGRAARAAYERHFTLAGAVQRWEEILQSALRAD